MSGVELSEMHPGKLPGHPVVGLVAKSFFELFQYSPRDFLCCSFRDMDPDVTCVNTRFVYIQSIFACEISPLVKSNFQLCQLQVSTHVSGLNEPSDNG